MKCSSLKLCKLPSMSEKLTKDNNKSHLDCLHFGFWNKTSRACSPAVRVTVQGNLSSSRLSQGNLKLRRFRMTEKKAADPLIFISYIIKLNQVMKHARTYRVSFVFFSSVIVIDVLWYRGLSPKCVLVF